MKKRKSGMDKSSARIRRGARGKAVISKSGRPRIIVRRTNSHIYASIVVRSEMGDKVLVSSSTIDKELKHAFKDVKKAEQAQRVGALLAERAVAQGIESVAFDRNGYLYHGRVKALADGAREAGLIF